jgi:hypothetical protein
MLSSTPPDQSFSVLYVLREALSANKDLARGLDALEQRLERGLAVHIQAIREIREAIPQLMTPLDPPKRRRIRFVRDD